MDIRKQIRYLKEQIKCLKDNAIAYTLSAVASDKFDLLKSGEPTGETIDLSPYKDLNIYKMLNFGSAVNTGVGYSVSTAINSIPETAENTVSKDEVVMFKGIVFPLENSPSSYNAVYIVTAQAPGQYGINGDITVTEDQLERVEWEQISSAPPIIADDPNAYIEDLGEIPDGDFVTKINTTGPYTIDAETNWYFQYTVDGKVWLYGTTLADGTYGTGETQTAITDYFLVWSETDSGGGTGFLGKWDADTNTPTLDNTDTDIIPGSYYIVGLPGTIDFGAGDIIFASNDRVEWSGALWYKSVDNDIPTSTVDITNEGADNTSTYVEHNELAVVATTGDYDDLINKPVLPQKAEVITLKKSELQTEENTYSTIAVMFADRNNQTSGKLQFVTDASGDDAVDSGSAYYEYLGTEVGDITDYRLITGSLLTERVRVTLNAMAYDKQEDVSSLYVDVVDYPIIFDLEKSINWSQEYLGVAMSPDGKVIFYNRHNLNSRVDFLAEAYNMDTTIPGQRLDENSTPAMPSFEGKGLWMKDDGLLFATTKETGTLEIWSGGTPWDFNNFTKESEWVGAPDAEIHFSDDGEILFILNGTDLERYNLSTGFDLSTRVLDHSITYPTSQHYAYGNFTFSKDLTKIYMQGGTAQQGFTVLTLTSPGVLTGAVSKTYDYDQYQNHVPDSSTSIKMKISNDGTHIICVNFVKNDGNNLWFLELTDPFEFGEEMIIKNS